jgi:hypothetical protein
VEDFPTIQSYQDAPALVFPVRHATRDLTLTTITAYCKRCSRPLQDLRGYVREYAACLDVSGAGGCPPCRCLTRFHCRWYLWGTLHLSDTGWVATADQPTWRDWLLHWWHALRRI